MNPIIQSLTQSSACLNIDELKSYLLNKLTSNEEYEVEQHLNICPACADALESLRSVSDTELEQSLARINDNIKAILYTKSQENNSTNTAHSFSSKTPLKPASSVYRNMAIAASIILLVGTMYNYSKKNKSMALSHTRNSNIVTNPHYSSDVNSELKTNALVDSANALLEHQQYQKCIVLLERELQKPKLTEHDKLVFLLFRAYWQLGNKKQADETLKQLDKPQEYSVYVKSIKESYK